VDRGHPFQGIVLSPEKANAALGEQGGTGYYQRMGGFVVCYGFAVEMLT